MAGLIFFPLFLCSLFFPHSFSPSPRTPLSSSEISAPAETHCWGPLNRQTHLVSSHLFNLQSLRMTSSTLPSSPMIGGTSMPRGKWANLAKESPWIRSQRHVQRKGTLLNSMSLLPLIREPTIRPPGRTGKGKQPWTGMSFNHLMAQKKCNAEALLAQATGELQEGDQACRHFQDGRW